MNRPTYEVSQDRTNEERVAATLTEKWGVECRKLPLKYAADFGAYRDDSLKGWVEIKCRRVSSTTYPDVILSVEKWTKIQNFAAKTRTRFVLVVAFTDGIFYVDETDRERVITHGGRKDRGDWQDEEPVVRIPIKDLKQI